MDGKGMRGEPSGKARKKEEEQGRRADGRRKRGRQHGVLRGVKSVWCRSDHGGHFGTHSVWPWPASKLSFGATSAAGREAAKVVYCCMAAEDAGDVDDGCVVAVFSIKPVLPMR